MKLVSVYRTADVLVVDSASELRALHVSNGWAAVEPVGQATAARLGELVLEGLQHSGEIASEDLPVVPRGATVASEAAGFASEDAMLAAGAALAAVVFKNGAWDITPAVNMGPGKGWSGHADAPEITHEGEWSAEGLGAAVLEALDAAARLSRV